MKLIQVMCLLFAFLFTAGTGSRGRMLQEAPCAAPKTYIDYDKIQ